MNVSNLYNIYINLTNDMDSNVKDEFAKIKDRADFVSKFKFKTFTVSRSDGQSAKLEFTDGIRHELTLLGYICIKSLMLGKLLDVKLPKCEVTYTCDGAENTVVYDGASDLQKTFTVDIEDEALVDCLLHYHFTLPKEVSTNDDTEALKHLISIWAPFDITLTSNLAVFKYLDIINNVKHSTATSSEVLKAQEDYERCVLDATKISEPIKDFQDTLAKHTMLEGEVNATILDMENHLSNRAAILTEIEALGQRNTELIRAIAEVDSAPPMIDDKFFELHQLGKNNYDSEVKDLQVKKDFLMSAKSDMQVEMVSVKQQYEKLSSDMLNYDDISEQNILDKKEELNKLKDNIRVLNTNIDELSSLAVNAMQKVDTARYTMAEVEAKYGNLTSTTVIDYATAKDAMQVSLLIPAYNKAINFISYMIQYDIKRGNKTVYEAFNDLLVAGTK